MENGASTNGNGEAHPEGAAAEAEAKQPENSFAEDLDALGKRFATAMKEVWESEERQHIETTFRAGFENLGKEINEAFEKARTSEKGQKVEKDAQRAKNVGERAGEEFRRGMVDALRSLSDTLENLAEDLGKQTGEAPKEN